MTLERLLTVPLDFEGLFLGIDGTKKDGSQYLANLTAQLTEDGDEDLLEDYVIECFRSFDRQFTDRDNVTEEVSPPLRLSQIGKPAVLQALRLPHIKKELMENGLVKDEPIDDKLRHIFHRGDVFEAWVIYQLKSMGLTVEREQEEIEFCGVKGHIDLVCDGRLVEVKTMSNNYFSRFVGYMDKETGTRKRSRWQDDTRGYLTQMALYQYCTGLPGTWLCVNKETNEIALVTPNPKQMDVAIARAATIIPKFEQVREFSDLLVKVFRAPPPVAEGRKRLTGRWLLPEEMAYSSMRHLFYKTTIDKNPRKKETEYFVDYVYEDDYKAMF